MTAEKLIFLNWLIKGILKPHFLELFKAFALFLTQQE